MQLQLSAHFTLDELIHSDIAMRYGIANKPDAEFTDNLRRLANMLEQVREHTGPVIVSSGYRSPLVNLRIGGSRNSAHMQGRAADFTCPGFGTPLEVCRAILDSGIQFDQLIQEGRWVHLAIPRSGETPRLKVLTAIFTADGRRYRKGLD